MKVKIRGLVFAGFAAAVFAQSALAESPSQPDATQQASDQKTVTSKWYVDGKFNGQVGYVMTQGDERGEIDFKVLGNDSSYIDATTGDAIPVSGKAVAEAMNFANIDADLAYHTDKIPVVTAEWVSQQGYTSAVRPNPTAQDLQHVDHWELIVPAQAIAETSGKVVNTNTALSGETLVQKDKLTTAGAVYDYAQPRFITESGTNSVSVGYKANGSDSTWTTLQTAANGAATSNANYVTMTKDSNNVYTVNLAADQVGTDGTGNDNSITANSTKLTTGKAVYEYLTNEFQPKVADDGGTSIYVGRWDDAANNNAGAPTWGTLQTASSTASASTNYVTMTSNGGVYTINIAADQLADTVGEIGTAAGAQGTLPNGLATAGGVQAYAVRQDWGSNNAGKTLVTNSEGKVIVTNVPRIPDLPEACLTNSPDVHCALVTTYYASAVGDVGDDDYIPAQTTVLEWTVMANPA